jgi:pimeloyl-ACP methyl ester carboxylesterase
VPLDYAKPAGSTLRIAVIRKRASGSRQGSLIINPGGPGASGLEFERDAAPQFSGVTRHFDLVSFDPRGVGQSAPIRCLTSAQLDAYVHENPSPRNAAELATVIRMAKEFADACWKRNGSYLAHVGTIDAARDMDVLRAALGDRKLTYYGASYGTYLGAKYAQLFPDRIRALVLDGALDPTQSTEAENRVQAIGFETDLHDFLAACVAGGNCPLGSSVSSAGAALTALGNRLDVHPEPVGARSLGAGEFFSGLALGFYATTLWPTLKQAIVDVQAGDGSLMLRMSDLLTERNSDGSYSNLQESNVAINCVDRPSPRAVSAYVSDADRFATVAPHFGAAIAYSSMPCAFWHVPPVEVPHAVAASGAPPIVVIGTTRDPATPYVWAQALARQLSSGVLVTFDGDGHTAYTRGNPCISAVVNAYLDALKVPAAGTRCA